MNPKLGTERRGHPAHTNDFTGISASEYVCEGGRGWEIRNIDLCQVSKLVLGPEEAAWAHRVYWEERKGKMENQLKPG